VDTVLEHGHHPQAPARPPATGMRRYLLGAGWIRALWMMCLFWGIGLGIVLVFRWWGGWDPLFKWSVITVVSTLTAGPIGFLAGLGSFDYWVRYVTGAPTVPEDHSTHGGRTWTDLPSLKGADPMGATATDEATLIAGHPGLFRSSDGTTFAKVTGEGDLGDVHALGGAGDVAYAGTPERGLLVSKDGGTTWTTRNAEAGRMFMGVILVDPADPLKLIAPDMSTGLVTSKDGGITWTAMGGPGSAMAAAWDPIDTQQLVVVGMTDSAQSSDGGATWTPLMMPKGASAATFSADGKTLYAAALSGMNASVYASTDLGRTWGRRSGPEASEN
jgi:hypothetical protein